MNLQFRNEKQSDFREVEELTRQAFWNLNAPGCDEHYLIHILRDSPDFIPELDFVVESKGRIVGHIAYSHSAIVDAAGKAHGTITFGPISVLPECQRQGIGRALITHTRTIAREMGFRAIIILGDPAVYSRLGFLPAERYGIRMGDLYAAALQVYELFPGALKGISGSFVESDVFEFDSADAEGFNKLFPVWEKRVTPSQSRFQEAVKMVHP